MAAKSMLPKNVKFIPFKQKAILGNSADKTHYLNEEGVCAGLAADYARFYHKRESQDVSKISFLGKKFLSKLTGQQNPKPTKETRPSYFARRIALYQSLLERYKKPIKSGKISDPFDFEELFKNTNYLLISIGTNISKHSIAAIKIHNKDNTFSEYRLFDANYGEYQNIHTKEDLYDVFKHVTTDYSYYSISDQKDYFPSMPSNKAIRELTDALNLNPMNLPSVEQYLKELPEAAKYHIGALLPQNPIEMRGVLYSGSDLILTSGKIVFNILEAAKRNKDKWTEEYILSHKQYLSIPDQDGTTALHFAASKGHAEVIRALIAANPDAITKTDKNGWTLLHFAASKGHTKIVEALIAANPNPAHLLAQDSNGDTPLSLAAGAGHTEVARLLIKANKDAISITDKNGHTPLHFAASEGHKEIVEALIAANPNPAHLLAQDSNGDTPLSLAAGAGHTEVSRLLIKANKDAINITDKNGHTPLHFAASEGHKEIVEALIAANSNPAHLLAQDSNGDTPLSLAAGAGHTEVATLLIKTNPDAITKTDKIGWTPLYWALENTHIDTALPLIEEIFKGKTNVEQEALLNQLGTEFKNEDLKVKFIYTAIYWSAKNNQIDLLKSLLQHAKIAGTDVIQNGVKDKTVRTALHWAAQQGHTKIVEALIAHCDRAHLLAQDSDGNTPLSLAASAGDPKMMHLLIDQNSDAIKIQNNKKLAPIYYAVRNNAYKDIVQKMIDKIIDIDIDKRLLLQGDDNGYTTLHLAISHGNSDTTEMLLAHLTEDEIEIQTKDGQSALDIARHGNHKDIASLLIEKSPNRKEAELLDSKKLEDSHHIISGVASLINLYRFFQCENEEEGYALAFNGALSGGLALFPQMPLEVSALTNTYSLLSQENQKNLKCAFLHAPLNYLGIQRMPSKCAEYNEPEILDVLLHAGTAAVPLIFTHAAMKLATFATYKFLPNSISESAATIGKIATAANVIFSMTYLCAHYVTEYDLHHDINIVGAENSNPDVIY